MRKIICLLLIAMAGPCFSQGFLHQSGQNIVDGDGNNIILRGLGLGGWMIQEGYMLQTDQFAGTQHEIRQKIEDLIGPENTEAFYQAYRDNGITKRDIDSLKAWGFNSIRLPMHYNLYTLPVEAEPVAGQNTWLDEGFQRTDQLLQWCAEDQIYLILDMHAAPGGQGKDANISDYDPSKPSLWESDANKNKMIALWHKLADRYKDSPWIGGYDLINEPNWNFTGTNQNGCDEGSNGPLRTLMVNITSSIREVDQNHMIIIEGNCWGNNYNGIFPLWDNNMALSFHKYWNANTQGSIQGMLNLRSQYNVPLWMGESGENSNVWFRDAISLVESNNIGWSFWPMKKIESIAGVTSVTKTPQYQQLLDYWNNGGTQPTESFATQALMQIATNYKMQNVTVHRDVIDAMFRQVQTTDTKKYKSHPLPGKVFATEYDMGTNGYAYYDTAVATYHTDTGNYVNWNQGWSMRNDGVDIQACTDAVTNGYKVSFIDPGEWLLFTLPTENEMAYDIDIRYAGNGGALHFEDAEGRISEKITLPSTGGFDTWGTATLTDVILKAGSNKIKIYFDASGFNLNWFEFKNPHPASEAAFKVIDASTTILGDKINVSFNKGLQPGIDFSQSSLSLKVNGANTAIDAISTGPDNVMVITPATAINPGDVITLTYAGANIMATDATVQQTFTDKPVTNKTGNIHQISGIIEAEDFYKNEGLTAETCTDTGGGQDLGYTDAGDYLDYLVNVTQSGNYRIDYRTSGESQTGQVTLSLTDGNGNSQDIQTVSLPPTGAWQTWHTTTAQAALPAGRYFMRVKVNSAGFNLNWIKFSFMAPDDDNDGVANDLDQCPDTPQGDVVDFNGCTLFSLPMDNFTVMATGESCRSSNNGSITVNAAASHNYVAAITGNGISNSMAFTDAVTFDNLQSGNYEVCITLPEAPAYQQCFDLVVNEPEDLAVLSRVMPEQHKVTLDLHGALEYTIILNDEVFTTTQNTITLDLAPGVNTVEVYTERECQGTYREKIVMDSNILVYPNPVNGSILHVALPESKDEKVMVEIYSALGKRVFAKEYNAQNRILSVDVSPLASGIYMMNIASGTTSFNTKIVRQ